MQSNVISDRVGIAPSLRDHIKRRLETTLNRLGRWMPMDSEVDRASW